MNIISLLKQLVVIAIGAVLSMQHAWGCRNLQNLIDMNASPPDDPHKSLFGKPCLTPAIQVQSKCSEFSKALRSAGHISGQERFRDVDFDYTYRPRLGAPEY